MYRCFVFYTASMLLLAGCSTTYTARTITSKTTPPPTKPLVERGRRPTLVLNPVTIIRDGKALPGSQTETLTAIRVLRETGLFDGVWTEVPQGTGASAIRLELRCEQHENQNRALNKGKAFLVGCSLFLLTPVVPLECSLDSRFTGTLSSPGGERFVLQHECRGSCAFSAFYPWGIAIEGVRGRVWSEHLQYLTRQLGSGGTG